jgi:DNA-binding winged helix-turn-helix (wHTH) protein
VRFLFEGYALDTDRRELRHGSDLVSLEPQVFDLLAYLIQRRDHVVSKDDLLAAIWHGRSMSESTLTTRINAARRAIGDSGDQQRLIKTLLRKGVRFVGAVREDPQPAAAMIAGQPIPMLRLSGSSVDCRLTFHQHDGRFRTGLFQ